MEFKNKHSNYFRLRGVHHLEADTKLLQRLNPDAKILRRLFEPDKAKLQGDVLWALLDLTTPEEIEMNRTPELPQKLPTKKVKVTKDNKTKPSTQNGTGKGKGKGKGKAKKAEIQPDPETKDPVAVPKEPQTVPEEKVTAPIVDTAEGEKKDAPADEGAGVPADQLGESGEPGHPEGNDPV